MGYGILTTPEKAHRETSSSSQKSASGEFFEKPVISHQEKRSQPLNLLLENRSCSTKNASALNIPVLWNGRRYDEQTDLYYYKYRYYIRMIKNLGLYITIGFCLTACSAEEGQNPQVRNKDSITLNRLKSSWSKSWQGLIMQSVAEGKEDEIRTIIYLQLMKKIRYC